MIMSEYFDKLPEDVQDYYLEFIDDIVDDHLQCWKDRYYLKSKECIKVDLYINYDHTGEIESLEHHIGRELTDEERKDVVEYFNKKVLEQIPD
jgi:hypothetical protein